MLEVNICGGYGLVPAEPDRQSQHLVG